MTLSQDDRDVLERRDSLTEHERHLITLSLDDLAFRAKTVYDVKLATDDRLAALEAALIRYMLASRDTDPKYVTGWHTTRLSEDGEYALETLYITRYDGSVASSEEHRYSDCFVGNWAWKERPDLTTEWVQTHCKHIGNYIDPLPRAPAP
jgi:hypothetical protein